jgi:hypothetical protein
MEIVMIQVGWAIVGNKDAKFGEKRFGETTEPMVGGNIGYWEARGYDAIPIYANEIDIENVGAGSLVD